MVDLSRILWFAETKSPMRFNRRRHRSLLLFTSLLTPKVAHHDFLSTFNAVALGRLAERVKPKHFSTDTGPGTSLSKVGSMTPLIDRVKTDLKIEDGETSSLETKVDEEEQSPEEPKETTVPCFVETKKRPSDDATPHYPPQPESRVLTADQRQQLMELAEQVSGSGSAKLVLGLAAHQTAVGLLAKDAPPISEAYEYGDLDFFKDFDPIKAIQVAKQMIREAAKRNNSGVGLLRLCFMGLSKEEQARVQLVCNEEYERAGKLQSVAVKILEEADRKVGGSEGVKPGETGGAPKKPNKARPPKPVEKRESAIKIEDLSGYPGKSNECLPWTRWGSSVPGLAGESPKSLNLFQNNLTSPPSPSRSTTTTRSNTHATPPNLFGHSHLPTRQLSVLHLQTMPETRIVGVAVAVWTFGSSSLRCFVSGRKGRMCRVWGWDLKRGKGCDLTWTFDGLTFKLSTLALRHSLFHHFLSCKFSI